MQNLSATLLSAGALLGGVACLARVLAHVDRHHALSFTNSPLQRALNAGGALCALSTFLFLPAGSFPSWLLCSAPALGWFAGFSLACIALVLQPRLRSLAPGLLAVLLLLGASYALCACYAYRHGLPGNFWQLERFVAVPLLANATPVACAGIVCLACADILACATALTARSAPAFPAACLQLAAAQYLVCLFFPFLPSRLAELPPAVGLPADFGACWACTGLLLILFRAVRRAPGWLPWPLAACGLAGLLLAP